MYEVIGITIALFTVFFIGCATYTHRIRKDSRERRHKNQLMLGFRELEQRIGDFQEAWRINDFFWAATLYNKWYKEEYLPCDEFAEKVHQLRTGTAA